MEAPRLLSVWLGYLRRTAAISAGFAVFGFVYGVIRPFVPLEPSIPPYEPSVTDAAVDGLLQALVLGIAAFMVFGAMVIVQMVLDVIRRGRSSRQR